jgi:precorrin-6A/cobalt-precorrin-6A reductase
MSPRVLVLGGTAEGRRLAALLTANGVTVVSSLAGRTAEPALPAGDVRIGGFGGPTGLADWLAARAVTAVVDATHPFATEISASARTVCAALDLPRLALIRPGWQAGDGDDWRRAPSLRAAADALPGERVFLTVGRRGVAAFAADRRRWFLIRAVDPPTGALPPRHLLLLARGPFTLAGELELMRRHRVEVLVTKDSGGPMTAAKLAAARQLGLPVVMVDRPEAAPGPTASTVEAALDWVLELTGPGARSHGEGGDGG